jgi:hypothetical protein
MRAKPIPADNAINDLASEIEDIVGRLVIRTEENDLYQFNMKPYVQWSKGNFQPLDEAIENLARRVRDQSKSGRAIYTKAEQDKLAADYKRFREQQREETKRTFEGDTE